jgi:glycosyltransferase involved in cell wall biosynthesis
MDAYLCSSVREGMPNSVLEAMAMEVPVIATRVGDVAYMLDQGRVGLLLERGEADEIARLILALMDGKIEGKVLAKEARRRVEREFSFEKRINLLTEDYDKLLGTSKCRVH